MKKVYTITFHDVKNYGAVLQAYALQKKILNFGYKTEIIDFLPIDLMKPYEVKFFNFSFGIKNFISSIFAYKLLQKKEKFFKDFKEKNLLLTNKKYYTREDLEIDKKKFQICIAGSDQIWNPDIFYSPVYFLDFGNEKMKRISYAASFGQEKISKNYRKKIQEHLKKIDKISVREHSGIKIIKELVNKNAEQVIDPVFLISNNEWKNLKNNIVENLKLKNGYILLYYMEKTSLLFELAENLKNYLKKPIVVIHPNCGLKTQMETLKSKNINLFNIGPQEFISLFVEADCIITNSFHGTAFSIIFDKPFLIGNHSTRNTRLESLLKLIKLEKRFINTNDKNLSGKELFSKASLKDKDTDLLLQNEIEKSEKFLKQSIQNEIK